jgi:hypothetical protein
MNGKTFFQRDGSCGGLIRFILLLCIMVLFSPLHGQYGGRHSLKLGASLAVHEGAREMGMGAMLEFGYQYSWWENRFRVGTHMASGSFTPLMITDTRDMYYRLTSLKILAHFDAIRLGPVALYLSAGPHSAFSRGLLGTGGWPEEGNTQSEYLLRMYFGGEGGAGLRIYLKEGRSALEISPFNFSFGTGYYFLGAFRLGLDLQLGPS